MKRIVSVDPGISTGGIVYLVRREGRLDMVAATDVGDGDETATKRFETALDDLMETAHGRGFGSPDDLLIEFPSATYHGKSNTAIMVGVCRVAAETALYAAFRYAKPTFIGADRLRRNGHIIADEKRDRLYQRIFGDSPDSEHVRDASLIAAFYEDIL